MKNKRTFASILWIIAIAIVSLTTCASMTITEVEWDTLQGPQKARQFLGISNSEVKVFAHFKNGDRRQTSAGTLRYDKNIIGPQTVIVSINGVAGGSFQTEVMKLIDIRVDRLPSKTAYTEGEQAALSGIKVMGKWEGMSDAEIPVSQLRVVDFNSSTEGSTNITVGYNGMNASFPVTVTARAVAPASTPASVSGTDTNSGNSGTPASASAPGTTASSDNDEWQRMIDRINLLVDNHFQNRDFDEEQNANWNLTGLSVGIYKNGRTAFFNRGFHESERRNVARRRPVTENSIFVIGSVSKPVSNIMLSYFSRINNPRTGRPYVNLNDPVNKYFKTKPFIDTDRTQVYPTLMQLAEHYGGISRETAGQTYSYTQFMSLLENLTYIHKPGAEYLYSSGSVITANVVASEYYGSNFPEKKFDDLLLEHLFRPLGMNSTMLHGWLNPAMQDRMTLPHSFNGAAIDFYRVPAIDLGGASGRITSTSVDMIRLAAFIIGDQVPAGAEVLQQAAAAGIGWGTGNRSIPGTALSVHESNVSTLGGRFREMFTRPTNSGQRYGRMLAHGGAIGGHNAYMIMCPDTKTAVVVLLNTSHPARGSLPAQIMDGVLNATYSGRRTPFNDFDDRVASYSGANANVDIVLNDNLTIEAAMNNIKAPSRAGATLTIRSANPARPVTLTRGVGGLLFTVPNGATLIFRDIIIDGGGSIVFTDDDEHDEYDEDGNPVARPPAAVIEELVRVSTGGTLIMENGAVLRNNSVNSAGGVGVRGTFNMRGGLITGNTAASDAGGVHIYGGTFNMSGGEISGNTAGRNGGGIGVFYGGVFTMTGGKINGNTNNAGPGGGVYVGRGCTFIMDNGEISGNTAVTNNSGGVRIDGAFTMNGGKISGNTAAANYGGGMSILSGGKVTMNGGEISGNNATQAGGVLVWTGADTSFTMNGGIISGNIAPNGSGLRINGGVCNLNGGVVAGTGANIGAVVNGTHNLNTAAPGNAVIIAWARPTGTLNYTAGSNTHLTLSAGATATWQNQSGSLGISYRNGSNTGWIKAW